MISVRYRVFQLGLMLATALSLAMLSTAGHAYTPEEQQACTDDAFRVCGTEIPDVDRVTACMVRNRSLLSPGCKVYFRDPDPPPHVVGRKPVNLKSRAAKSSSAKSSVTKPKKPKKPE